MSGDTASEARILCVDDEPRVLDGMRRTLGMNFDVSTAESGAQALALLENGERFALTISDMRMPGMDGAAYLERAAQLEPDMVRMLLTGHSDMQAAIRAINQGRIFRFLTKPCDAEVLEQAVEDALAQHRLITAERELLQKTLYGCVKVLTELLSLVNPLAFNRACRVNRLVAHVAKALNLAEAWQLDLAVMLAHLGYVGMAPELLDKAYAGKVLSSAEKSLVSGAAKTAHGMLAGVPRIEFILEVIEGVGEPAAAPSGPPDLRTARVAWARHIIAACERADQISHAHMTTRAIADALRAEAFQEQIVEALAHAQYPNLEKRRIVKLTAKELKTGMFLVEDALSMAGVLMAKGGQEITATVAVLLRRMAERQNLKEPLIVSIGG